MGKHFLAVTALTICSFLLGISFHADAADSLHLAVTGDTLLCSRDTVQLQVVVSGHISPSGNCGGANALCLGPSSTIPIGNDTLVNMGSSFESAVYGDFYSTRKIQIIYPAAELIAAGMTTGSIKSLSFDIADFPTMLGDTATKNYHNFEIKMMCVPDTILPDTQLLVTTGVTDVFTAKDVNLSLGWNTHAFDYYYNWDGQSSLLVEICFDNRANGVYTFNAETYATHTSYTSTLTISNDFTAACMFSTNPAPDSLRPNTRFGMCNGGNYTITWVPLAGIYGNHNPTIYVNPDTTTQYKVIITTPDSTYTDSVLVQLNLLNLSDYQSVPDSCRTGSGKLFVTPSNGTPPFTFDWQTGASHSSATIDSLTQLLSGDYSLSVTDANGCSNDILLAVPFICNTGITEIPLNQSITLYPNPNNGHFVLSITQATQQLKIELLNIQGQILYTEQRNPDSYRDQSSFKKELDFNDLAKGVYLLKVSTENGVAVKRVVVE